MIVHSAQKLFLGSNTGRDAVVYKVLAVNGNVLTMFIEGEDRKTDGGDPVVWSLVLNGENEFYWRRSDWPKGMVTGSFRRCG